MNDEERKLIKEVTTFTSYLYQRPVRGTPSDPFAYPIEHTCVNEHSIIQFYRREEIRRLPLVHRFFAYIDLRNCRCVDSRTAGEYRVCFNPTEMTPLYGKTRYETCHGIFGVGTRQDVSVAITPYKVRDEFKVLMSSLGFDLEEDCSFIFQFFFGEKVIAGDEGWLCFKKRGWKSITNPLDPFKLFHMYQYD
jgi:hypothetical protein